MTPEALARIEASPLAVDVRGPFVRVVIAADKYTVARISSVNDREEYARLFAAAPTLYAACKGQHSAIDLLLAMLAERDRSFMPSKSAAWPAVLQGHAAIALAEGRS